MPIYEYQCQSCQHEFEILQKISEVALIDCPECREPSLKKKISAAGFRLSGSGWYETDFKKSGTKKNLVGDAGASGLGDAGGKGDAKADSNKTSGKSEGSKSTGATTSSD